MNNSIFGIIASGYRIPSGGGGQTVQINLTDSSHHTLQSGWVNYDLGMTPAFLVDIAGVTTGWKLVVSGDTPNPDGGWGNPTPVTPDFPGDIGSSEWYIGGGQIVDFNITGLNNSKTYTIKTFSYDPGAGNPTDITWGGTLQTCNPANNPSELTFSSITPTSGAIAGTWSGSADNPIINGIIIIEN